MRKSINEKLRIVKESTSSGKIKKMSIQHGITTKTIRNWINLANEGKLNSPGRKTSTVSVPVNAGKRKVLKNIVFKRESVENPFKDLNGGEIYRHLFTDQDTGFEFCAYTAGKVEGCLKELLVKVIEEITRSGKSVRKFITDSVSGSEDIRKLLESYGAELEVKNLTEIKKHLRFSLKKHNYIRERAKYENEGDFLFDSLATVCRNNEIILGERNFRNKALPVCIKKINITLHSKIFTGAQVDYNEQEFISEIQRQFDRAMEFHKVYDTENADAIYEKIYYILKGSDINQDMFVKILIQRAKIYSLIKDYKRSFNSINAAVKKLRSENIPNGLMLEHSAYFLASDINRIRNDKSKTFHYLRKGEKLLEAINNPETTAVAYLNFGRVYSNFGEYRKTEEYYEKAKGLVYGNKISKYYATVEESFASLYSKTGKYEEAKQVFEKMIIDGHYSDSPYFRALLFAKNADIYHLTGHLSKSIGLYDSALDIVKKHEGIRAFTELMLIIAANKAYTLIKTNRCKDAREILESNLDVAKSGNFATQVFTNIANLILCDIELKNPKSAFSNLNRFGDLLKNNKKPEYEYKYLLGKGDIEIMNNRHEKACGYFERALEIAERISTMRTPYYDTSLKYISLQIDMKEYGKAEELAKKIRKNALKEKFNNYVFKAELFTKKAGYYKRGQAKNYLKYLNSTINQKDMNEESVCFMKNEMKPAGEVQ